jgi:hypothetical protein
MIADTELLSIALKNFQTDAAVQPLNVREISDRSLMVDNSSPIKIPQPRSAPTVHPAIVKDLGKSYGDHVVLKPTLLLKEVAWRLWWQKMEKVNRRMIKAIMKEIGIDSGSLEQELL